MSSGESGNGRPLGRGSDRRRALPPSAAKNWFSSSPRMAAPFTRWLERPARPSSVEARAEADTLSAAEERAAELFRRAPAPPAFGPQARARVAARLAAEPEMAAGGRVRAGLIASTTGERRRSPGRARVATWGIAAAFLLFLFGGAVIAARGLDRWRVSLGPPRAAMTAASDSATNHPGHRPRRRSGSLTDQPTSPPVSPAAPATTSVATSGLARESRLLNVALEKLRLRNDGAGALETLARYRMAFPNGTLATEATTMRVDALLMLNRQVDALTELDGMALGASRREQELRVVRGELRARSALARSEALPDPSACRLASADFSQILSEPTSSELRQRALHGRAVCRARDGETRAAERDVARYLRQFPDGRFAPDLRRLDSRAQAR